MSKIKVGITTGDINGIGLEVIIKTLINEAILDECYLVIYGSPKVVSYHKNVVGLDEFQFSTVKDLNRLRDDKINVVTCWQENAKINLGTLSEDGGKFAYISLDRAMKDLKEGHIDALVTAPIHKKAMEMANFPYAGHTEFITKEAGSSSSLMMMVSDVMKVGLVTAHVPLNEVAGLLSKELVAQKLKFFERSLIRDFGIDKPKIAVLGLNPHAGDDGLLGNEEQEVIRPVLIESKKKGKLFFGPFSADGFFGSGQFTKFDGILAMYHDQGLIPFKSLTFGEGVNFTAGLSVVRTSPDHGTAFELAGKNLADEGSFRRALFTAIDVVKSRRLYDEMHANPVKKIDPNEINRPKKNKEVKQKENQE